MHNCSVCLESKHINDFKINKNCGHICICGDCFTVMIDNSNNVVNTISCPICRSEGEYMNIYMTEVVRPEEVRPEEVRPEEVDIIAEEVDIREEENENMNYLTKMLNYSSSSNYTLVSLEDSRHLYFEDKNISKSNFVEAYYGTEYSYIDGRAKLVDVTKRVAMALAFNKSHLIVEKNNLIHNVELEQAINENFNIFIVLKIE